MREDFRNCFRLRFDAAPPNSEHRDRDEALRNRICAPVNIKSEKETSVVVRGGGEGVIHLKVLQYDIFLLYDRLFLLLGVQCD